MAATARIRISASPISVSGWRKRIVAAVERCVGDGGWQEEECCDPSVAILQTDLFHSPDCAQGGGSGRLGGDDDGTATARKSTEGKTPEAVATKRNEEVGTKEREE
ncbi:hypothetical protein Scep_011231 [Stephania cephalantha]|uniref:Uncharacterized protein n=1 Tax=Stephania cephalantha TaxID=152367 RepID=A0AAP0JET0_9MAGN